MPTLRDRGPGTAVPSQSWRTFVRNHAGALIRSGIFADLLTRGAQAVSTRIRRSFSDGATPSHVRCRGARRDAVPLGLLIAPWTVPATWSPGTVEVLREDDQSSPEMRHSGTLIPVSPPEPHPWTRVPCDHEVVPVTSGIGQGERTERPASAPECVAGCSGAVLRAKASVDVCCHPGFRRDPASASQAITASHGLDQRAQGGRRHDQGQAADVLESLHLHDPSMCRQV